MIESNIYIETFFLLFLINSFVLSDLIPNFYSNNDRRQLVKRHDDFQTCLDNFDIHQDKIIRTQDSRDMGAKYINEREVLSRDDCLRLCCETENCDVFVFEEKSPGSCYMFECGSPEDFKCKFTKHKNYTSAVLAANRHLTELESQIKFTQHEHELTKLRHPPEVIDLPKPHPPTTEASRNEESIKYGIERPPSQSLTKGKGCSRYQFECHTSGECIAIYNACDGIPQCSDGSDEAVELGCPATSTSLPTASTPKPVKEETEQKILESHKKEIDKTNIASIPKQTVQAQYVPESGVINTGYPQSLSQPNVPAPNLRASYGREGEGMANYHPEQQWSYQYHPSQGSSQIFTHKGNGLIVPQQSERFSQHQYIPQEVPQRPIIQQYGEQFPNTDYSKYYYDNMGYRVPPQGQAVNTWQAAHKPHEIPNQMLEDGNINRLENLPVASSQAQDYYYEEGYRKLPQSFVQRTPVQQTPHVNVENKMPEIPVEVNNDAGERHDVPKKKPPTHQPETTTLKPIEVTLAHVSHRKVEKVSAEIKMKESSVDDELDGHNTSPSGAVLSLTLGLCITGIMLIFVGCRMKVVRKRMRRGGKSPYAHDADFLVNGMYL